MLKISFIFSVLFLIVKPGLGQLAATFKNGSDFPQCQQSLDGIFEDEVDGCLQVKEDLIWGPPSYDLISWQEAYEFCQDVNSIAHDRGEATGWRLATSTELFILYKSLRFASSFVGFSYVNELENGAGFLSADLSIPIWSNDTIAYEGRYQHWRVSTTLEYTTSFSLQKGIIEGYEPKTTYYDWMGHFIAEDGTRIRVKSIGPRRALCVRNSKEAKSKPKKRDKTKKDRRQTPKTSTKDEKEVDEERDSKSERTPTPFPGAIDREELI